jgi:hypothetical protein
MHLQPTHRALARNIPVPRIADNNDLPPAVAEVVP